VALVLVVSPRDLKEDLQTTVLGGKDVEWLHETSPDAAVAVVAAQRPRLVIVSLSAQEEAVSLVRRLRKDDGAHEAMVVVLLPSGLPSDQARLGAAGANAVLTGRPDPFRWDATLERLLHVSPRRAVRLPVRFWLWFRVGNEDEPVDGRILNVSTGGMLLESPKPVEIGTRIEAQLQLKDGREDVSVVGEIAREAGSEDGRSLYGVAFKGLGEEAHRRLQAFVDAARDR
jgi:CheY-like chemotaxis protein